MKKLTILIIAFLFIEYIAAQQLKWIVKPVITDTEEISVHPFDNALIKVEKNGKYGVKNQKNEILIPLIHKYLDISIDQKYIYLGKTNELNSIKYILNTQGDTLKFDRKLIAYHPCESQYYSEKRHELNKFALKHGLQVEKFLDERQFKKYRIKNTSNEIIIDSLNGFEDYLDEGYLAVRKKRRGVEFYDKNGRIIFNDDISITAKSNGKGYFFIKNRILNSKFEEVYVNKENRIGMIEGYELFYLIGKNAGKNELQLYNLNEELALSGIYSRIDQIDSDWLIMSNRDFRQIYSLKEKEVIFKIDNEGYIYKSKVKGWMKVGAGHYKRRKFGAYNYQKKELMLDTIYSKIIILNDRIVTTENKDAGNYYCTAYTKEGKELFQVKNEEIMALESNIFLVKGADDVNRIVGEKGKTLLDVDYHNVLRVRDSEWVYKVDVRNNKIYYSIKDISEGKTIEYKSLEKLNHKSMCSENIYIVSKNDKYGLYSSEDGIIVPCVYDVMRFSEIISRFSSINKHSEVVTVLENGKWGAFINPCIKSW